MLVDGDVKRDLAASRAAGVAVPTRGQIRDIGPGVSHKAHVVQLYLWGMQFTEIDSAPANSEDAIRRYVPAAALDTVRRRAEGNPFFVTELVRLVAAHQAHPADLPGAEYQRPSIEQVPADGLIPAVAPGRHSS